MRVICSGQLLHYLIKYKFVVKNLPFADIFADGFLFVYDTDIARKYILICKEDLIMRHIYIRGFLALLWFMCAVVSGISGNLIMAAFYMVLGGVFLYSSYTMWKKEKDDRGEGRDER